MKKLFFAVVIGAVLAGLFFYFFAKPPALPNAGNTCFMNAALQSFYNVPPLREIILGQSSGGDLYQKFYLTIQDMMAAAQDNRSVNVNVLKELGQSGCQAMSQVVGAQNDPTEFMNPIFNIIPLAGRKLFAYTTTAMVVCPLKQDQTKFEELSRRVEQPLFMLAVEFPKGKSNLFDAFISYFKEEPLQTGIIPVGDVEYLGDAYQYDPNDLKHQGVLGKFDTFTAKIKKNNILEDKIYIKNCVRQLKLATLPDYLIIHLKRFESDMAGNLKKIEDVLQVPFDLDMKSFCDKQCPLSEFNLIGVIIQTGGIKGGHYYAYIKDQYDAQQPWYNCDDSTISKITDEAAMKKDIDTQGYVFFYKNKDAQILDNLAQALYSIVKG